MNPAISVFDFDKTLTDHDTVFGFYAAVNGQTLFFRLKTKLLFVAAVLHKIRLIDNSNLKKFGVFLFLRGESRSRLERQALKYAESVQLNDIYKETFLSTCKKKRLIISASFEIYLQMIFPNERVLGSSLIFDEDDKVAGLDINMYGAEKKRQLVAAGISKIDCLYTDSYSDKPLMSLARTTNLVKGGRVVEQVYTREGEE